MEPGWERVAGLHISARVKVNGRNFALVTYKSYSDLNKSLMPPMLPMRFVAS